jgi:hypothetical protein
MFSNGWDEKISVMFYSGNLATDVAKNDIRVTKLDF